MTFGHVAIGLAIARAYERDKPVQDNVFRAALFVCGALSPDVDFILLPGPGVSAFAHRGVTHSLFTACVAGLVAFFLARRRGDAPPLRLLVSVAAVIGSHGVADLATSRGRGVALFTACVAGLVAFFLARRRGDAPPLRLLVSVAAVIGSHGVADVATSRGRGVALFWPLTSTRFDVIGLVPAAPFPPEIWDAAFWPRAFAEIAFSVPLVAYALLPRRPAPS